VVRLVSNTVEHGPKPTLRKPKITTDGIAPDIPAWPRDGAASGVIVTLRRYGSTAASSDTGSRGRSMNNCTESRKVSVLSALAFQRMGNL